MPWPPPAGWRKELARKHAVGEEVVPLRPYGKPAESPAGDRDEQVRAADPSPPVEASPARVWTTDIGPVDPADPPPWM